MSEADFVALAQRIRTELNILVDDLTEPTSFRVGRSGFGFCTSLPSATGQELRECAFVEGDFEAIDRSANQ